MGVSRYFGGQGSEKGVQTPNSAPRDGCDLGGERCGIRVSPSQSPFFARCDRGARKLRDSGRQGSEKGLQTPNSAPRDGCDLGR